MGGKQSTNSPNSRQQNRTSYAHTSSSPLVATGSDPGRAHGSHDRIRARTFNDINSDNRPLAVPRELFDQRYVSEFGLASASLQVNGRRRRRRERDDSNETNSLPSHLFSAFISGIFKAPPCVLQCFVEFSFLKKLLNSFFIAKSISNRSYCVGIFQWFHAKFLSGLRLK